MPSWLPDWSTGPDVPAKPRTIVRTRRVEKPPPDFGDGWAGRFWTEPNLDEEEESALDNIWAYRGATWTTAEEMHQGAGPDVPARDPRRPQHDRSGPPRPGDIATPQKTLGFSMDMRRPR